jgi:hypothetical protein
MGVTRRARVFRHHGRPPKITVTLLLQLAQRSRAQIHVTIENNARIVTLHFEFVKRRPQSVLALSRAAAPPFPARRSAAAQQEGPTSNLLRLPGPAKTPAALVVAMPSWRPVARLWRSGAEATDAYDWFPCRAGRPSSPGPQRRRPPSSAPYGPDAPLP